MKPGKCSIAKLEMKGKDPNQWYQQTDTYGSWRDIRKTGLRNAILKRNPGAQQKDRPQELRGEPKAFICPTDTGTTDWLLGENKEY